jgi:hypothetical protein
MPPCIARLTRCKGVLLCTKGGPFFGGAQASFSSRRKRKKKEKIEDNVC